jgi:hypothetical protein
LLTTVSEYTIEQKPLPPAPDTDAVPHPSLTTPLNVTSVLNATSHDTTEDPAGASQLV